MFIEAASIWKKLESVIDKFREYINHPHIAKGFEYLYNKLNEREQQLTKAK
jgi:hypothetical protein